MWFYFVLFHVCRNGSWNQHSKLHSGQRICFLSHFPRHFLWKWWPQDSEALVCDSPPKQMAHGEFSSMIFSVSRIAAFLAILLSLAQIVKLPSESCSSSSCCRRCLSCRLSSLLRACSSAIRTRSCSSRSLSSCSRRMRSSSFHACQFASISSFRFRCSSSFLSFSFCHLVPRAIWFSRIYLNFN